MFSAWNLRPLFMYLCGVGLRTDIRMKRKSAFAPQRGLAVLLASLLVSSITSAEGVGALSCRSLESLGKVYDYNDDGKEAVEKIAIVEANHFNSQVRTLQKGQTNVFLASDIAFVLYAIPNHYEALSAMGRWQILNGYKGEAVQRIEPADCYYRRAQEFRPTDPVLRIVYGVYLHRAKRWQEAKSEYLRAQELGGESAELFYNMGLLWLDMGDVTQAKDYADMAYSMGYPLPGLRNKLRNAGVK
jgi:Flp pilus assembly protein TadD